MITDKPIRWLSSNLDRFKQRGGNHWSADCPSCDGRTLNGDGWAMQCANGCVIDNILYVLEPLSKVEDAIRLATARNGFDFLETKSPASRTSCKPERRKSPEDLETRVTALAISGQHKGSFVKLPHAVLESKEYARLRPWEVKLLVDLLAQYKGRNNGHLVATWSYMCKRGWRSPATLNKSMRGLKKGGFVRRTHKGGTGHPSRYSITWLE
jgi:hypothetical protein